MFRSAGLFPICSGNKLPHFWWEAVLDISPINERRCVYASWDFWLNCAFQSNKPRINVDLMDHIAILLTTVPPAPEFDQFSTSRANSLSAVLHRQLGWTLDCNKTFGFTYWWYFEKYYAPSLIASSPDVIKAMKLSRDYTLLLYWWVYALFVVWLMIEESLIVRIISIVSIYCNIYWSIYQYQYQFIESPSSIFPKKSPININILIVNILFYSPVCYYYSYYNIRALCDER